LILCTLSRIFGIKVNYLRRLFFEWCREKGFDPEEFTITVRGRKELNVPREFASYVRTHLAFGVRAGMTIREAAKALGLSETATLGWFHRWCREMGLDPKDFRVKGHFYQNGRKITLWRYEVPREFVRWVKVRKLKGKKGKARGEGRRGTLTWYARKFGISRRRVRTAFKWYCYERGLDPKKFYIRGVGIFPPEDFEDWLKKWIESKS